MDAPALLDTTGRNGHRSAELRLQMYAAAVSMLALALSPLAGFALASLLLLNLSAKTPRHVRLTLGLAAVIGLALMTGCLLYTSPSPRD